MVSKRDSFFKLYRVLLFFYGQRGRVEEKNNNHVYNNGKLI